MIEVITRLYRRILNLSQENIIVGAFFALLAMFSFSIMNAGAKLLTQHHVLEIGFYRNLFGIVLFGSILLWKEKTYMVRLGNTRKLVVARSIIGCLNLILSFSAFQALPMANAQVLMFTSSLFIPILGFIFLGERVGPYRYAIIFSGFIGVFLIAGPSIIFSAIGVTWALFAALCQASQAILLRRLGQSDSPLVVSFWFMLIGTLVTGLSMPWVATVPSTRDIFILIVVALAGSFAQLFLVHAYLHLQASVMAALNYSQLIWASLWGVLFWNTWPTLAVIGGGFLIAGGNFFILWREHQRKKESDLFPQKTLS